MLLLFIQLLPPQAHCHWAKVLIHTKVVPVFYGSGGIHRLTGYTWKKHWLHAKQFFSIVKIPMSLTTEQAHNTFPSPHFYYYFFFSSAISILLSLTSEVEVLPVIKGSKVDMFYDVSFGPIGVLALSILGCLQHGHPGIGKVSGEDCIQRSFFLAARGTAGTPTTTDATLLHSRKQGSGN